MSKILDKAIELQANGLNKTLKTALEDGSLAPAVLDQTITVPAAVENSTSAVITAAGVLDTVAGSFIQSVVKNSTGNYTINFVPGKFTVIPAFFGTARSAGPGGTVEVLSISTSSVNYQCSQDQVSANDVAHSVLITKQGADYVDPLTATTTSNVKMTQAGIIQESDSSIRVDTANGYGSAVSCKARRFSNVRQSLGSAVTYTDSPTEGAYWTINETGLYSISYTDSFTGQEAFGISVNAPHDVGVINLSTDKVLAHSTTSDANFNDNISWQGVLSAGDIIRPNANSSVAVGTTNKSIFSIAYRGTAKQVAVNPLQKATIPTSELRFTGASGISKGSTATSIIKFDTQSFLRGDAFEINPSGDPAVYGTHIKMLKAGKLDVSANMIIQQASMSLYISKNQSVLTSIPTSAETVVANNNADALNHGATVAASISVVPGDVIRICSDGTPAISSRNTFHLLFQAQEVSVSVSNTLPQFSASDSIMVAQGNAGQAVTSNGQDVPFILSKNIGIGSWNGTQYTVAEDGIYNISSSVIFTTSPAGVINLFKNGTLYRRLSPYMSGSNVHRGTYSDHFVAGDILSVRAECGSVTLSNSTTYHNLQISKVGKPNVTGVDVTPFVRGTLSEVETIFHSRPSADVLDKADHIRFNPAYLERSLKGILVVEDDVTNSRTKFVAKKRCKVDVHFVASLTLSGYSLGVLKNGSFYLWSSHVSSAEYNCILAAPLVLEAGEYISFYTNGTMNTDPVRLAITAVAQQDHILTPIDSFSTDTAPLTFSSTYTLATLKDAPVGTFITFGFTANTNSKGQNASAPTQSVSDMNVNGIKITGRAYNAGSGGLEPAMVAIQVGKNRKGFEVDYYHLVGKDTSSELYSNPWWAGAGEFGVWESYNEATGVLVLDAGVNQNGSATSRYIGYRPSDYGAYSSAYAVINSSKSPALAGIPATKTVAVRAVQSSGQSIPNNAVTTMVFDTAETYDSHGSFNPAAGEFTAPESGYYTIKGSAMYTANGWAIGLIQSMQVHINGTQFNQMVRNTVTDASAIYWTVAGDDVVRLNKGDKVTVTLYHNFGAATSLYTDPKNNFINITKVGN